MKKELAISLQEEADRLAKVFSDPQRNQNYNKEVFKVVGIVPTSDHVAMITFHKEPSGKAAVGLAMWNNGFQKWMITFLTDSHYLGLMNLHEHKRSVEKYNWGRNFK